MGALSPMHWAIIIGVVVLLFGAKRLPDMARSLGHSARILKAEVKELNPETAATPTDVTAPYSAQPDPHTANGVQRD